MSEAITRHKNAIRGILHALIVGEINEVQAVAKLMSVKPHCETCGQADAQYVECSGCASSAWCED